jgi:hypothetical protein
MVVIGAERVRSGLEMRKELYLGLVLRKEVFKLDIVRGVEQKNGQENELRT